MGKTGKKNANKFIIFTVFLVFFEIGLPSSIIGAVWPTIRAEMGLPLEYIGFINIALLISSMLACIFSGSTIMRFDFKKVFPVAISIFVVMLFAASILNTFAGLLIVLIPIGYSMGTLDGGTNLYASINFESRYMSLLHCCWGIGAMTGPLVMVAVISAGHGWRWCFGIIAIVGILPLVLMFRCSIKRLWNSISKNATGNNSQNATSEATSAETQPGKIDGVSYQFYAIMLYVMLGGGNVAMSSFISSYMDEMWSTRIEIGGITVTLFLASLTVGRIITGIAVKRTGNQYMIRMGLMIAIIGCIIGVFATSPVIFQTSVILYGLGTGPVFPLVIHETPMRFTEKVSRKLVGLQVAGEQLGGSVLTMIIAAILVRTNIRWLMPIEIILYGFVFTLNEIIAGKKRNYRNQITNIKS